MSEKEIYEGLTNAVVEGLIEEAAQFAQQGIDDGLNVMDVINNGVIPGTDKLGELFQEFEIFLPELIMGGDAAKAAMAILVPHIPIEDQETLPGTVVIGTVSGDIHDIGKNLVGAMLAASGFEVIDLGVNVSPKAFVDKAEEVGAKIIGLSALMSTSLYYQQGVVNYLNDVGLRDKYFVIIGGGPVTPEWASKIAVDGVSKTASGAADLCKQLVGDSLKPPLSETIAYW